MPKAVRPKHSQIIVSLCVTIGSWPLVINPTLAFNSIVHFYCTLQFPPRTLPQTASSCRSFSFTWVACD